MGWHFPDDQERVITANLESKVSFWLLSHLLSTSPPLVYIPSDLFKLKLNIIGLLGNEGDDASVGGGTVRGVVVDNGASVYHQSNSIIYLQKINKQ